MEQLMIVVGKMDHQTLLTKIMIAAFNYDTSLYFGSAVQDGPAGYNNGRLAKKILTDTSLTTWLIKRHTDWIGFITFSERKREIAYFCVQPQFIRQGYGSAIWRLLLEHCGPPWQLATPDYSVGNQRFYEQLGFRRSGEQFYENGARSLTYFYGDSNEII